MLLAASRLALGTLSAIPAAPPALDAVIVARAMRRVGGVTGDAFGAAIEMSPAAVLVALS